MLEFSDMSERAVGIIPQFLSEYCEDDAVTQLNANYAHGGGWRDFEGFSLVGDELHYPGDPPTLKLSEGKLRGERILVFEYGWVAVVQPDNTFRVARMD